MKLHYMIEYALRDRIREPRYEPVGIWVQGPGPGLDLVILVENDIRTLPEDFLAYHQVTLSPYRGIRGPVVETDDYPSVEACAKVMLPPKSAFVDHASTHSGH